MGATSIDFFIQGIREGITDIIQLAERAGISTDEAKVIYRRDKKTLDGLKRITAKENKKCSSQISGINNQTSRKNELQLAKENPFPAKYTDSTKTKLCSDQLPEHDLYNMFEQGETSLDKILTCYLQFNPNKTRAINALNIISMPWLPENNWKSSVLQRKDSAGNIVLHLQRSISFEMKEAIQAALKEMSRPEAKKTIEPTPLAPPATQLPKYYPISDECPYKYGKNKNQTYAVICQILMNNKDGISQELLKKKATEITHASPNTIDAAITVVTSRRNRDGIGRDFRALPGSGYWVERSQFGRLILHLPEQEEDSDKKTSRKPTRMPI